MPTDFNAEVDGRPGVTVGEDLTDQLIASVARNLAAWWTAAAARTELTSVVDSLGNRQKKLRGELTKIIEVLELIVEPDAQPRRKDSTDKQVLELAYIAKKLGMDEAASMLATFLNTTLEEPEVVEAIEDGQAPKAPLKATLTRPKNK